ncbi:hypothetical protein ARMGADRAFT_566490 [Armillaria gallica]|uniref:Uncharacterized protein n=1 Tax=Armillaria gallica TaxID=47427 RepID=A0A2H3DVE7_ARMGA|nr:hypothetical protein ARMGADRAFT_566490 [Armillaria gallica]
MVLMISSMGWRRISPPTQLRMLVTLEREGIIERYNGRTMSLAWGLVCRGYGFRTRTFCGKTGIAKQKERMVSCVDAGGIPNYTTIDWVP